MILYPASKNRFPQPFPVWRRGPVGKRIDGTVVIRDGWWPDWFGKVEVNA